MDAWIEILRAGDYPQGNVTLEDLQLMARYYDPNMQQALFIPEHRKFDNNGELINNMPALGWIKAVRVKGSALEVLPENADELKMFYDGRSYKYASAEIETVLIGKEKVPYLGAVAVTNFPASKIKQIKLTGHDDIKVYTHQININKEEEMKPEEFKKLCKILGIPDNSTPVQVEETITKLTTAAGAQDKLTEILKLVKVEEPADKDKDKTASPEIKALTEKLDSLTTVITKLTATNEAAAESDALVAFTEAVQEKKLLPSQQEVLVGTKEKPGTFYKNASGLRAFAKTMPVLSLNATVTVPKDNDGKPMTFRQLMNNPSEYIRLQKENPVLFNQLRNEWKSNPAPKTEEKK